MNFYFPKDKMKKFFALVLFFLITLACRSTESSEPSLTPVLPTTEVSPTSTEAFLTLTPETAKFNLAKLGQVEKDITYCTMDGVPLKVDVYYPAIASASWPLVIYVHGGGWEAGDKSEGAGFRKLTGMQNTGFLVASVDYRLAPKYKFPAQIQDVKCAVRYFRAHAAEYNINPDKIGLWGGSAGGHLVALAGTSDSSAGWDVGEYLDQSSRVQAVVDMFGPTDLTRGSARVGIQAQLQRDVFGSTSATDPILAAASPVTYVTADDPPFLILQGDADTLVPLEQSQILYDKLQAVGVSSKLLVVRHAGHGFQQVGNKEISPSVIKLGKEIVKFFTQYLK
jgi:acetyl esterase/lipase